MILYYSCLILKVLIETKLIYSSASVIYIKINRFFMIKSSDIIYNFYWSVIIQVESFFYKKTSSFFGGQK